MLTFFLQCISKFQQSLLSGTIAEWILPFKNFVYDLHGCRKSLLYNLGFVFCFRYLIPVCKKASQRFCGSGYSYDICHPGFASGNGSCLIQHHHLHLAGFLQRNCRLKQNPIPGTYTVAYHDSHRSSQSQSTGTADHQHGYAPCQGKSHTFSQQQPYTYGQQRNDNNRRHKHSRYLICYLCNGCLGCCSITDHLNDLG